MSSFQPIGWNSTRPIANVRLVEVDVDTSAYEQGHISGAIAWNWESQLCDNIRRDVLTQEAFEKLMSQSGIEPDTTVVLYGDNNNWFACYAFWQLKLYGHRDARIMNGGRKKWLAENRATDQGRAQILRDQLPRPTSGFIGARVPRGRDPGDQGEQIQSWWTCARPTSTPAR
jgi:thiosulfate/3-mercaptopyruvate sulfurtransferase